MGYIDYPYEADMRFNDSSTFHVGWVPALPGAVPFPEVHAFGTSHWSGLPGDLGGVGEVQVEHSPFYAGSAVPGQLGQHTCGSLEFWQEGWPDGTPPSDYPDCCEASMLNSIGLLMPSDTFLVTPGTLTADGDFDVTYVTQLAGVFHRGPYSGSGPPIWGPLVASDIPPLPASQITSGTFSVGLIPSLPASQITSGVFSTAQIPGLPASQITSGTFSVGLIPGLPASQIVSGAFALAQIPSLPASQITSGTFSTAQIPNLDASKITTGTFSSTMIPSLDASKITTGTFNTAQIPGLDASILVSGTIASARLPSGLAVNALSHGSATSTSSYVTLFSATNANGLHGSAMIRNTGSAFLQGRLQLTDVYGNVQNFNMSLGGGGSFDGVDIESQSANYGPPWTSMNLQVQDTGTHGTLDWYVSLVG